MKPKVSVIVPVYNAENYLSRCLDSLLKQSISDIEIIVINDGSTDNSGEILKKYEKMDGRIRAIHKGNEGLSEARNIGINYAQGEYIGFVDSDDWVDSEMYNSMYSTAIATNIDIVMCTYTREYPDHSKPKLLNLPDKVIYDKGEVRNKLMRRIVGPIKSEMSNPEYLDALSTVWSKIYRTSLMKENNVAFTDLKIIGTAEDALFNIHALYYAESALLINKPYYHYWRANVDSVTSVYKPDLKEQWFNLYSYIEDFLKQKKLQGEFHTALNNRICMGVLGLGLNTISSGNLSSSFEKVSQIKVFLSDERIVKGYKEFDVSEFPITWKVFYLLAKYRASVPFYVMLNIIDFLRKRI